MFPPASPATRRTRPTILAEQPQGVTVGTEISLDIGGISVDWSKNLRGVDHGALYQEQDRKRFPSDQIDYAYFEREGQSTNGFEMSFSRTLRAAVPRLEMLGFRLETVRQRYEAAIHQWREDRLALEDVLEAKGATSDKVPAPMSFDEFLRRASIPLR